MIGFEYKIDTCIGCSACQVACQDAHHLLNDEYLRKVKYVEELKCYVSMSCNHCENPGCVKHCPTGAMYILDDVVLHDDKKCIGCGACLIGCPYHAVSLSKKHGFSQKCDSCYELRKNGLDPVCVAACPTHSLSFKEIDSRNDKDLSDGLTQPKLLIVGGNNEKL